jgi:DNA-3-methyladenine glycosylase II
MIIKLNETNLLEATHFLSERDPALAFVFEQHGYPPLWSREPGFATLVHIVLEQQVSLASANAAFSRLRQMLEENITPARFLECSDERLRAIGFSRQKTHYTQLIAKAILEGDFQPENLDQLSDEAVKHEMKKLKGIGDWTADIYLSECLMRPDILPKGDIAMQEAFRALKGLEKRPAHPEFEAATEHWRPWRSVGTRLLWHYYLCTRRKTVQATI